MYIKKYLYKLYIGIYMFVYLLDKTIFEFVDFEDRYT